MCHHHATFAPPTYVICSPNPGAAYYTGCAPPGFEAGASRSRTFAATVLKVMTVPALSGQQLAVRELNVLAGPGGVFMPRVPVMTLSPDLDGERQPEGRSGWWYERRASRAPITEVREPAAASNRGRSSAEPAADGCPLSTRGRYCVWRWPVSHCDPLQLRRYAWRTQRRGFRMGRSRPH